VMAFFLSGMPRAVATCGTALADEHFRMLKNFTRNIVLAYDADAAGQKAAEKFYEWETRFEIRLNVAALPAGRDPADVWRDDPSLLTRAVEEAKPFLQFRLERMLATAETTTIEGKARAAEQAMVMINEHPNEIVRGQYITLVAVQLGLDAAQLVALAERGARRPRSDDRERGEPAAAPQARRPRVDPRELAALRVAIHEPALVSDRLHAPLFVDPVARCAFDALASAETLHDAIASATTDDARDLLERLAVEEPAWGDDPAAHATEVIVALVESAATRRHRELVAAGDMRASDVKRLLSDLAAARSAANWVIANQSADQLLPWLADPLEV